MDQTFIVKVNALLESESLQLNCAAQRNELHALLEIYRDFTSRDASAIIPKAAMSGFYRTFTANS